MSPDALMPYLVPALALWLALLFVFHAVRNLRVMNAAPTSATPGSMRITPLVGGACGAVACLLAPWPWLAKWWWLPLLLDLGALPYMLMALIGAFGKDAPVNNETAHERAGAGSLLGTAVGDALGLASEGLSKERQRRMFPDATRYHFLFGGWGMCSDDTEHACMTAQALLGAGGNAKVLASTLGFKLRWWFCGLPAGIGLATLRASLKLWLGFPAQSSGVRSSGNGPAMRAPLIGVCYGHEPAVMRALVLASTRLTHRDRVAEEAALAVALAAHLSAISATAITPQAYLDALTELLEAPGDSTVLDAVRTVVASIAKGESAGDFAVSIGCAKGITGWMLHTLPAVIHVWLRHQDDLSAALATIIRLGGDSDTTAAIVGGIVGARVGPQGIPAPLLDKLVEWPRSVGYMRALGARAALAARGRQIEPELPLFVPGIVPRNAFFMIVVLLHGFRRLLPPY